MNELEGVLRSWWNNYRDVKDETGFQAFAKQTENALHQQLRAERTGLSQQQVKREELVEIVTSGALAVLIGSASGGRMSSRQATSLGTSLRSVVRTMLYPNNTSRK
jgi:hypothetical protein